jgi:hypothetical protein
VILLFNAINNGALLPSTSFTLQEIHLVRCLTYIRIRYIAPERSLGISAGIHRNSIWFVVVTVDGNVRKPDKIYFTDRECSYIILISYRNFKCLKAEINMLAKGGGKLTRFWNFEFGCVWLEQFSSHCRNKEHIQFFLKP